MTEENRDFMLTTCDTNDDGDVTKCELHDCMVYVENMWRKENCEKGYPPVWCPNPNEPCGCKGKMTCDDIEVEWRSIFAKANTNKDKKIDKYDKIDEKHFKEMMECDKDGDKEVTACELWEC